jgi:FkbM family methyltransferase
MRHDIRQLTDLLKQENFKPTTFIEIGSRDGHDTAMMQRYWNLSPKNCYIIEAHPILCVGIEMSYPQFNTFNVAASNKTGIVQFQAGIIGVEENVGVSSVLNRTMGELKHDLIEVESIRMDEFMNENFIDSFDFMKIDVEGFGLQVLEGFGDKIKKTKYIQIEVEIKQVWEGQSYYTDIVEYMKTLGFEILDEVDLDQYQKDIILKNINL